MRGKYHVFLRPSLLENSYHALHCVTILYKGGCVPCKPTQKCLIVRGVVLERKKSLLIIRWKVIEKLSSSILSVNPWLVDVWVFMFFFLLEWSRCKESHTSEARTGEGWGRLGWRHCHARELGKLTSKDSMCKMFTSLKTFLHAVYSVDFQSASVLYRIVCVVAFCLKLFIYT